MLFPFFLRLGVITIGRLKFKTLEEAKECYGEDSLIPIDFIKQIIFYTQRGVQPVYICESEKDDKKGKLVAWFLNSETQWVYKKWIENRPK